MVNPHRSQPDATIATPPAQRWLVAGACLLAFVLRAYRLDGQSLWYDEAYSLHLARMPLAQMVATTAADIHPPLYYLLLKAWLPLAGQTEFALRSLSLLLGVAAVPATWVLARRLFGGGVAGWAALLVAGAPFYVHYGQETRMYTLMGLCALVATLAFLRGAATGRWLAWGVYVAAMVAGLYSHLYSALTFGSLNLLFVVWLVATRRRAGGGTPPSAAPAPLGDQRGAGRRVAGRRWLMAQALVVVFYAPWIGVAVDKYLTYTSPAGGSTLDFVLGLTLVVFATGHAVLPITVFPGQPTYDADMGLALALSAPCLLLAIVGAVAGARARPRPADRAGWSPRLATAFAAAMLLLPLLAILLLSVGRRDYNARYLYTATPWFFLLVAAGLAWLARGWRALPVVPAALLCAGVWTFVLGNYYFAGKYARDDHRAAVAYLQRNVLPGDLVVLDANFDPVYTYYAPADWPWLRFPDSVPPVPARTLATLANTAPQYRRVWLLMWGDYFLDPDRIVQGWLDAHATRFDTQVFPGLVIASGYLMRSPSVDAAPPPTVAAPAEFGGDVALAGYDVLVRDADPARRVHLTLHMRALRQVDANLSVFVSLLTPAGEEVGHADALPVTGALPVPGWQPGRTVLNEMDLWVDPAVPPGDYRLRLGVYDQTTMRRLPTAAGDTADLGNLRLPGHMTSLRGLDLEPTTPARFGDAIRLVALRLDRTDTELIATYVWRADRPVDRRYVVFNHVVGPDGAVVTQRDAEPVGGAYPTDRWVAGELVRDVYRIPLTRPVPPSYRLLVGLYDRDTGARLPVAAGWWPFGRRADAYEASPLPTPPPGR